MSIFLLFQDCCTMKSHQNNHLASSSHFAQKPRFRRLESYILSTQLMTIISKRHSSTSFSQTSPTKQGALPGQPFWFDAACTLPSSFSMPKMPKRPMFLACVGSCSLNARCHPSIQKSNDKNIYTYIPLNHDTVWLIGILIHP